MQAQQKKLGKFGRLHEKIDKELRVRWEAQQHFIRGLIIEKNDFHWNLEELDLVAGVDISASKEDPDVACAALVVFSCKLKQEVYEQTEMFHTTQPYIPGFLAFRQVPILLQLFSRLKLKKPEYWPQLVIVDGNGILHQNRCGLACHLGVHLNLPTIGVGKTFFFIDGLGKQKVKEQSQKQIKGVGDFSLLIGDSGRIWGAALRNTKAAINPIFVSVGHKIELDIAIKSIMKLSYFRVVQPIRLADKRSRQLVQKWQGDKNTLPIFEMPFLHK